MKIVSILLLLFSFLVADASKKELSFNITDIQGNSYHITNTKDGLDIKELRGKIVFIAFFGHNCPPCLMEIPGFTKFTNEKEFSKKAVILAFELQGLDKEGLKNFSKYVLSNYRMVPGIKYPDFIDLVGNKTNWKGSIPFMVVLDQKGKIVRSGVGLVTKYELEDLVNTLSKK